MLSRGWRAVEWICTDHSTSLHSTVELRPEISVKELAELGAIFHVVSSIPPYSSELAEGRPLFAAGLELDKINKIAGDLVVRDSLLTKTKNGFTVVL